MERGQSKVRIADFFSNRRTAEEAKRTAREWSKEGQEGT